jgi:glycosyltransferase involved in cell wall biosynthesis|nr:glycosyltransferase [uncultured Lachnoclostridium sp.]
MNIAYCSPFNPIKSGISDFSEELLMGFNKYLNVDLFYNIQPSNLELCKKFNYFDISKLNDDSFRSTYDIIVYHMGNNVDYHKCIADMYFKHPGILELHDFSLHNYLAGDKYLKNDIKGYLECVRYCHGEEGERIVQRFLDGNAGAPWENYALKLTVNKHFIDIAKGVIVHSDMAKQMVKGIRPDVPVINIPLHTPDIIEDFEKNKQLAKIKLNINDDILVFGSFGYATRAKRILEILDSLVLYKKNCESDFLFFIVGKVEGIDVDKKLKELDLEDNVIVTGYTELEEFKTYMSACDICFNLRYPTHGESSASLHRMLGLGKPVIVTKIGTFEEYPEDIVKQVGYAEDEVTDIYNALRELTSNANSIQSAGRKAVCYAKEKFDLNLNIERYIHFFEEISKNIYKEDDVVDAFIDTLFDLDLYENEYMDHIFKKLDCF